VAPEKGNVTMTDTSENRQSILEMLAAGKISVEDAADMIRQLEPATAGAEAPPKPEAAAPPKPEAPPAPVMKPVEPGKAGSQNGPRWLHIHVNDLSTGQRRVTVNVPLRMLQLGLRVGGRFAPELSGMDWQELSGLISSEKGMLVEVQDEEDGEHVQIFVD
jgi:hypothetical protein